MRDGMLQALICLFARNHVRARPVLSFPMGSCTISFVVLLSYYFFYDMVAGKYMCIELCPFVFSLELIRLYGREVWSDMGFLVVWLVVVCGLHVLNAVLDVVLW